MKYIEIVKQIDAGSNRPFLLLYGKEEYLMDRLIGRLHKKMIESGECEKIIMEAEDISYSDIYSHIYTVGFFSNKKLLVINDAQKLVVDKNFEKMLEDNAIKDVNTVFIATKKDGSFNKIKKHVDYVEVESVTRDQLQKWIAREFQKKSKNIGYRAINYLIDNTRYFEYGSNTTMYSILMEINKILSTDEAKITEEIVKKNLSDFHEDNIFIIIESIASDKSEEAFALYHDYILSGGDLNVLLTMLSRNYMQLILARVMSDTTQPLAIRRKMLGIRSDYILRKITNNAMKMSKRTLSESLELCLSTQHEIRTTGYASAKEKVDELLLKLAQKK